MKARSKHEGAVCKHNPCLVFPMMTLLVIFVSEISLCPSLGDGGATFPALLKPQYWSRLSAESSLAGQALVLSQKGIKPCSCCHSPIPQGTSMPALAGDPLALSRSPLSCQGPAALLRYAAPLLKRVHTCLVKAGTASLHSTIWRGRRARGGGGTRYLPGGAGTGSVLRERLLWPQRPALRSSSASLSFLLHRAAGMEALPPQGQPSTPHEVASRKNQHEDETCRAWRGHHCQLRGSLSVSS